MKELIFTVVTLTTLTVFAQNRKFITTPTVAYSTEKGTKAVGIFLRGAMITHYEMVNGYIYKVTMDYNEPVYITDNYNVKDYLNTDDEVGPTPAAIIDNDIYYASPHLFTTVAGLKVREFPSAGALVVGTLLNGTVVPIDYFPYDENEWIPVATGNKKGYIPRKFVGERPVLENLLEAYKKSTSPEDQKKYIERILELGWNSDRIVNAKALRTYSEYVQKNGQAEIAALAKLQAEILDKAPFEEKSNPVEKLIAKKQFGFMLNGALEPKNGFSLLTLEKSFGKITKSYSNLDDCALGDYETNIFFSNAECIGHDINKTYHLRNLIVSDTSGFLFGNVFLNAQTTESEFLTTGKGYIATILPEENSYQVSMDYMSYEFVFKNHKLWEVKIIYYC